MKRYVMTAVWPLLLCAAQAGAELRVIADLGGSDASVFYEAINRQEGSSTPPPVTAPLPAQGETLLLPVTTQEMTPGEVTPRPLQLPGIGRCFWWEMMRFPVSGCRRMRALSVSGRLSVWLSAWRMKTA